MIRFILILGAVIASSDNQPVVSESGILQKTKKQVSIIHPCYILIIFWGICRRRKKDLNCNKIVSPGSIYSGEAYIQIKQIPFLYE